MDPEIANHININKSSLHGVCFYRTSASGF